MSRRRRVIRPLGPDDTVDAVTPLLPGRRRDARARAERLVAAAAIEPLQAVVAIEGGEPVALAEGAFGALGFHLRGLYAREPDEHARAARALLRWLRRRLPGARIDAVAPTGSRAEWVRASLEAEGFEAAPENVHYGRDLCGLRTARSQEIEYRDYRDIGRAAVTDLLDRILPDDDELALDAVDLIESALFTATRRGDDPDTSLWRVPYVDDAPAGLSLCHVEPELGSGTMLYIGVVPEQRGKGLGTRLHLDALRTIHAAGARSYADTTRADNHAMRRVFEHNGCERVSGSRPYASRPAPTPERLRDFGALVILLESREHPHQVRDAGGWLTATMRFADVEAPLDVVWSRDLRMVTVVRTLDEPAGGVSLERLATKTAEVNERLDEGVFLVDAETRTLRFQVVLAADRDGSVATETLLRTMRVAVTTAARSEPTWRALADGARRSGPSLLSLIPIGAPE